MWAVALGELYTSTGVHTTVTVQPNLSDKQAFMQAIQYRKDYRRLKKQEGAIKLVGGEKGAFEG
jgi:hypothetical protein